MTHDTQETIVNSNTRTNRAGASELISFTAAGLCMVLALVVAPRTGGPTWPLLAMAAFLGWQGYRLRKNRAARASRS